MWQSLRRNFIASVGGPSACWPVRLDPVEALRSEQDARHGQAGCVGIPRGPKGHWQKTRSPPNPLALNLSMGVSLTGAWPRFPFGIVAATATLSLRAPCFKLDLPLALGPSQSARTFFRSADRRPRSRQPARTRAEQSRCALESVPRSGRGCRPAPG